MHSKYEKVVYWFVFLQLILTLSFYSRGAELTDVSVLRKLVNVEVLSLRYEKHPKITQRKKRRLKYWCDDVSLVSSQDFLFYSPFDIIQRSSKAVDVSWLFSSWMSSRPCRLLSRDFHPIFSRLALCYQEKQYDNHHHLKEWLFQPDNTVLHALWLQLFEKSVQEAIIIDAPALCFHVHEWFPLQ